MEVNFETISGNKKYVSIQLKTDDENYRTAIETAKAVCMGSRIVLFKKDDNTVAAVENKIAGIIYIFNCVSQ